MQDKVLGKLEPAELLDTNVLAGVIHLFVEQLRDESLGGSACSLQPLGCSRRIVEGPAQCVVRHFLGADTQLLSHVFGGDACLACTTLPVFRREALEPPAYPLWSPKDLRAAA